MDGWRMRTGYGNKELIIFPLYLSVADPVDCEYIETEPADTALLTVAYVMAGVCGLCLLPVFILLGQASCKRKTQIYENN